MSIDISCIYIYIYVYHIFLIHQLMEGYLGCVHSLAIIYSGVINMDVQVSLFYTDLHSFSLMPRVGKTGLYGGSILFF
jgi:hypothetical protein